MRGLRKGLVLLPVLLLSGCGLPGGGVAINVERQLSDIVFGEPTAPRVNPAPQGPYSPGGPNVNPGDLVITTGGDTNFVFPYTFHRRSQTPTVCPTAPPGAAALYPAGADTDKPPKAMKFQWYDSYTNKYVFAPTGSTVAQTLTGFEDRSIENVSPDNPQPSKWSSNIIHQFSYDYVQPDQDPGNAGGTVRTTFAVKTWSDINQNPATYNGNNDAADGVAITKILRTDKDGKQVDVFQPTTSYTAGATAPDPNNPTNIPANGGGGTGQLLVFTLPVASGTYSWDFTAVDQVHQWTEEVAAQTNGRRTLVDACGQPVDGWPVTANVTITKSDASGVPHPNMKQTWKYVFATEYSAIPIAWSVTGDTTYGSIQTDEHISRVGDILVP